TTKRTARMNKRGPRPRVEEDRTALGIQRLRFPLIQPDCNPFMRFRGKQFCPPGMPFAFGSSLWQVCPAPKEILDEKATCPFAASFFPGPPTAGSCAGVKFWLPVALPVFFLQLWPTLFRSSVLRWLLSTSLYVLRRLLSARLLRSAWLLLPPSLLLWRIFSSLLSAALFGLRTRLGRVWWLGGVLNRGSMACQRGRAPTSAPAVIFIGGTASVPSFFCSYSN